MIISIASGKGGTGKTTVAVNLALALKSVQFLDCDVEEPNAHLFLKPEIEKSFPATVAVPELMEDKCSYCGRCREVCAFKAITVLKDRKGAGGSVLFFHHLCHSCGACRLLCPNEAIYEIDRQIGLIREGSAGEIRFVEGKLDVGEILSPPLIRQVKKRMDKKGTVIIDAPPGTSCPVIEAVKGSDFCLLVTEPTPFGLSDLTLAVEVLRRLGIPAGILINRSDIGDNRVEEYAQREGIPVLMRIPFEREIARLYSQGLPLVGSRESYADLFLQLYEKILRLA